MSEEIALLARQPIFDAQLKIFAYELLFRSNDNSTAGVLDGDHATSVVMLNAFTEIGIYNLVGNEKAFINFTRNLILDPPVIGDTEIVVEVLETVTPDPEIIRALKALKQEGHIIALDDFVYQENYQELIALADIIKIDVLAHSPAELEAQVKHFANGQVKLLAEKVETQEMYQYCKQLGFHYFQGYFLSKPKIVKGRAIPANEMVVIELLSELQSGEPDVQKLHDTIAKDPALSYKLLKMINSAAYRRPRQIESLSRAILLLGLGQIRRWASLLALSKLHDKPTALHEETMILAKMCEFFGNRIVAQRGDLFFTLGILSMLDAFFNAPLEELLGSISMSDEMNAALLRGEGVLGFVLKTCRAYTQGRWGDIDWNMLLHYKVSINDVKQSYIESLRWSMETGKVVFDSLAEAKD